MKRLFSLLLAVMLIIPLLAGCGSSNTGSAPTTAPSSSSSTPSNTSTTPAADSKNKKEVVFTYARSEDIAKWDTFDQNNLINSITNNLIYDYLVATDHKGNFSPDLAKEWSTSADGLEWTFKLRDDVKFHNGDKFTSSDVKITFDRVINNKSLIRSSMFTTFKSIETPDPTTVKFTLSEPTGTFLTLLATFPVTPGKLFQEKGVEMFKQNIGTGPWKFVEWVPGQQIVFVKNTEYWGGNDSNVDKIIYRPIKEDTTRISGVRTGELDMVDGVPPDQKKMLSSDPNLNVQSIMCADQIYVGFQFKNSIFADINARRAVDHAIDRKALTEKVLGGGKPANWPVPDVVMGYDSNGKVPEYNVELAKDYLKKANYNGSKIRLIGPNSNYPRIIEILQAVQSMLTDAGFNVNLEMLEGAGFQERRVAGQYDIYITGCAHGNGDPGLTFTQRWVGDSLNSSYKSETLNNLVKASNRESDPKKRNELLRQACEEEYKNLAPWGFLYQLEEVVVSRKNISGVTYYGDKVVDLSHAKKN